MDGYTLVKGLLQNEVVGKTVYFLNEDRLIVKGEIKSVDDSQLFVSTRYGLSLEKGSSEFFFKLEELIDYLKNNMMDLTIPRPLEENERF